MVKRIEGEEWKPFLFAGCEERRNRYAISSHGRMASYKTDLFYDGKILKGSTTSGYKSFNTSIQGRGETIYIHREVANHFVHRDRAEQQIVIHVNFDKSDNRAQNLRWVDRAESARHQSASPARIAFNQKQRKRKKGLKLTEARVREIKALLNSEQKHLTNRQIARKYRVSEMTIYRIKRGENWGWV